MTSTCFPDCPSTVGRGGGVRGFCGAGAGGSSGLGRGYIIELFLL